MNTKLLFPLVALACCLFAKTAFGAEVFKNPIITTSGICYFNSIVKKETKAYWSGKCAKNNASINMLDGEGVVWTTDENGVVQFAQKGIVTTRSDGSIAGGNITGFVGKPVAFYPGESNGELVKLVKDYGNGWTPGETLPPILENTLVRPSDLPEWASDLGRPANKANYPDLARLAGSMAASSAISGAPTASPNIKLDEGASAVVDLDSVGTSRSFSFKAKK